MAVGSVHRLPAGDAGPVLAGAITAFLATLDHPETAGTHRVYSGTLRALRAALGADRPVADLGNPAVAEQVTAWFTYRWADKAPATYNRNLDALRSAIRYWTEQSWLMGDPTRELRRRGRAPDRTKALAKADIQALFTLEGIGIRERTLWQLLYETAARANEVLALDVPDLDLRNRCAKVRRKGSAVDVIVWRTGTARLLPRLLKGRGTGPVFLTDRRARVQLPPCDLDLESGRARLSYRRAAELFEQATRPLVNPGSADPAELKQRGGWSLHQLRHSALTHAAEDGANTSTLLSYSGHTSVASLARYARVSPEALARWQQQRDPARRRP
jgi:integrase/recombinase XerC/integrase/recombinase XerD